MEMNDHFRPGKHRAYDLDLSGTFIRRTDLSGANLERADFTNADCSYAIFRGANFKDAILDGTILRGADLTGAINLTREQLSRAIINKATKLPDYLTAPATT
jgi:uncharacterized protein YjbI with pentapeptide repeats